MKPIEVTEKFRPFSHQPGIQIPYPLLQLVFIVYPSKIKIVDWRADQKVLMTLKFKFKSSCEKFTAFYDLHKNVIQIQSHLEEGYVEFTLKYDQRKKHFTLSLDRHQEEYLSFEVKRPQKTSVIRRRLTKKKPLILFKDLEAKLPKGLEVLFLGCHKKQEVEKIFARKDLKEFLPLWFLWGQTSPVKTSRSQKEGTLTFLSHIQEKLDKKEHDQLGPYLKKMMSSSFAPMMVPYLEDFKHWGFHLPRLTSSRVSPWLILSEIYQMTRKFFISQKGHDLYVLPHLPKELPSGRLIRVREKSLTIHLEWTKKRIRRMIIFASKNTDVVMHFQNNVKQFRLKTSHSGSGRALQNHCELQLKKNKTYYFDRFEK